MKKTTLLFTLFLFATMQIFAQGGVTITGTVTEESNGEPIPGATIQVKDLVGVGTVTDFDGNYTLEVPAGSTTLVFSYVGLLTTEEVIGGRTVINVALAENVEEKEEVVIVAYGKKKQEAVTGAVSTIGAKQIADVPVASFDNILQGKTAGLMAISNNGSPGSEATITIRGIGSFSSGTAPLFIIDGVPVGQSSFSSLNPNNIESMSVLKDASATAMYGSRGANGVILITTKRGGIKEKTAINYRGSFGFGTNTTDQFTMMNTDQKIDYELALGLRDTLGLGLAGIDTVNRWKAVNTDWNEVFFQRAPMQSHEVSAAGGNEKTKFFVATSFYSQDGTLQRSDFQRWNGQFNFDHMVSDKLSFGNTLTLGWQKRNLSEAGGGNSASVQNPVFAAYLSNPYEQPYLPSGEKPEKYNTYPFGMNPYREITLNDYTYKALKIVSSLFGEYSITDKITFRSTLGLNFSNNLSHYYTSPKSYSGKNAARGGKGSISESFGTGTTLVNTNTLRYSNTFGKDHSIDVLLGHETEKVSSGGFSASGVIFSNDINRQLSNATEMDGDPSGSFARYSGLLSYFGTVAYGLKEKYYIDGSIRRDGSSKFGSNFRYANFWSVGASWAAQKEDFFKGISAIDNLMIRASAGTSGNSNIGTFQYAALYGSGVNYDGHAGSYPGGPENPDITWEQSFALNLGIELGLFKKVNTKIELYHKGSDGLFLVQPLSLTTGFSGVNKNIAAMYNRGVETTFDYTIIRTDDFVWNVNLNFAYNVNKITALYGDEDEISDVGSHSILKVGEPLLAFWIVDFAGVNPANGTPLWYDANGNITNAYDDEALSSIPESKNGRTLSAIAPFNGGFGTNFTYKGLILSSFFTFTQGNYIINNLRYFTESNGIFGSQNQDVAMLDYWRNPGDITEVQELTLQTNEFDTRMFEEGSFLRLRELSLSYQVPAEVTDRMKGITSMRIYTRGQNVWTYTKYKGFDPEFVGNIQLNQYPAIRVFTIGLDLTI